MLTVDASSVEAYQDGAPDVWQLISFTSQLCRPRATLV